MALDARMGGRVRNDHTYTPAPTIRASPVKTIASLKYLFHFPSGPAIAAGCWVVDAAVGITNRRRFRGQGRRNDLGRALRLERTPSAQHFIQHRPEAEDVAATIQFLAAHLLGRHVGCRTH